MKIQVYKILIAFEILLIFSCKNENLLNGDTVFNTNGTPKRKVVGDIRDSVYYYSQTLYLWYKNLPNSTTFNPLKYANADEVIAGVRTYSEKGLDGNNRDRWSFVMNKSDWNAIASGNSKNHGLYFRFTGDGSLYVRQVFSKSAAGLEGIQRGWKVININGITPVNNDSFISQFSTALGLNSVQFLFEKPDGTQKQVTLQAIDYQTNTLQEPKVFESGDKKIGYFCLTDFLGDNTSSNLNQVFTDFKAKSVNNLIVDLRYNGGGYVSLAQELANLIAPSSTAGKVMFTYEYNYKFANYSQTTKFAPSNKLEINKIVFITTKNSASASELLINSLKPHMDVKIVGSASHGKPVGFPVIPVMTYVVAPVAFKTVNSLGAGDYYDGFKPDFPEADDLTKNFGDPTEKCLKTALDYIKTGIVTTNSNKNGRINAEIGMENWNEKLPKRFEGMYQIDPNFNAKVKSLAKKTN